MILFSSVVTPGPRWPEWIACVPLLMYLAISVDDKLYLSKSDFFVIFSMFLSILFGFLLVLKSALALSHFYLIASTMFWLIGLFQYVIVRRECLQFSSTFPANQSHTADYNYRMNIKRKKLLLTWILLVLTPLFVLVYLTMISHSCVSLYILTKLLFTSFAVDIHIEIF